MCCGGAESCHLFSYGRNFIDMEITDGAVSRWRLMSYYCFPERGRRRDSWALLRSLVAPFSDHSPIILKTVVQAKVHSYRGFKFENAWCREEGLTDVVVAGWNASAGSKILTKLVHCSFKLSNWSKQVFGSFRMDVQRWYKQLEGLRYRSDEAARQQFEEVKERLSKALS